MENSCRVLRVDDIVRSKLAIAFTNCHLQKSGLSGYVCTSDMTVHECTKDMLSSPIAFNTYTEFTGHVDNICFYIQSELFQQKTENLVNDLLSQSEAAINTMKEVDTKAHSLSQHLDRSEKRQNEIIKAQQTLQNSVQIMNEQEKTHLEQLEKSIMSTNKLSDHLKTGIHLLAEEQKVLNLQQAKFSNQQLENIEKLNSNMVESLKHSRNVQVAQQSLQSDVNSLKESQQQMNKIAQDSLQKQEVLLKEQSKLSHQQSDLSNSITHTMKNLQDQSHTVQNKMDSSLHLQQSLIKQQELANNQMNELRRQQEHSFNDAHNSLKTLEAYSSAAATKMKESHKQFEQHFSHVNALMQRVLGLNLLLAGEFMTIWTLFFYLVFITVIYLLTATKSTEDARFYMYTLISVNIIIEYLLISMLTKHLERVVIYTCMYTCRKLLVVLSMSVYVIKWYYYVDPIAKQHELLSAINKQQQYISERVDKSLSILKESSVDSAAPTHRSLALPRTSLTRNPTVASMRLKQHYLSLRERTNAGLVNK
jgi:septal ring factor EnvC (AmiA/AmiB activator)